MPSQPLGGKPPAKELFEACEELIENKPYFRTGSQGNAIKMADALVNGRYPDKTFSLGALRKYVKLYRVGRLILEGAATDQQIRWFHKYMPQALRGRAFFQPVLQRLRSQSTPTQSHRTKQSKKKARRR